MWMTAVPVPFNLSEAKVEVIAIFKMAADHGHNINCMYNAVILSNIKVYPNIVWQSE